MVLLPGNFNERSLEMISPICGCAMRVKIRAASETKAANHRKLCVSRESYVGFLFLDFFFIRILGRNLPSPTIPQCAAENHLQSSAGRRQLQSAKVRRRAKVRRSKAQKFVAKEEEGVHPGFAVQHRRRALGGECRVILACGVSPPEKQ